MGNGKGNILVVDDEPNAVKVLSAILTEAGYRVLASMDVPGAIGLISDGDPDVVVTDLKMPGQDGMDLFEYLNANHPDIPVIFLTAYGTVESAVSTVTNGAFYYFIKPPDYGKLKVLLARAVEQRRLKRELGLLKKKLDERERYRMIGNTAEMRRIFDTTEAIKDSASSVLISGETGTGKEVLARRLHFGGARGDRPFVAVNCAAIPRELLESELFGYEKGAFTGAFASRSGKFEDAEGGTLFLDEIAELELSLQSKLLRVLQERELERLGSSRKISVDFRLVSSTNRDLAREVESGRFREDLYYRVNVIEIKVPPLKERMEDLPLLVGEFMKEFCGREGKLLAVSEEVMRALMQYHWPGNIRQLKNVIERAVVLTRGSRVTSRELPPEVLSRRRQQPAGREDSSTLKAMETQAVRDALKRCKGNKSRAARMLGISRKAFYKRLKDMGVSPSGT
ncbi:MAG: sigma-54 dependent transcriptional regulator [Thermodesulfovibrionales bacterium]